MDTDSLAAKSSSAVCWISFCCRVPKVKANILLGRRTLSATVLRVFGKWKGRTVIQGVVLLNKRLNLPFRRLVESPFKLLSTRTTRLVTYY